LERLTSAVRQTIENQLIFYGEGRFVEPASFLVIITLVKNTMALLRALGLGVAIIVLQLLAPQIWSALEHLILSALSVGGELVSHLQAAAAVIPLSPPAL